MTLIRSSRYREPVLERCYQPALRNKSASCHRVGADYQQEAAKQVYGFQVALLLYWRHYNTTIVYLLLSRSALELDC